MLPNKHKQNAVDHEELMESELFELAAREVNWHLSPGETDWKEATIVQAARQVLVDGRRTTPVAEGAGISQAWLSQAIGRVREQLEIICARENWVYKMIVLSPEAMALVKHIQNRTIDPLKQQQVELLAKKTARKIKATKSAAAATKTATVKTTTIKTTTAKTTATKGNGKTIDQISAQSAPAKPSAKSNSKGAKSNSKGSSKSALSE